MCLVGRCGLHFATNHAIQATWAIACAGHLISLPSTHYSLTSLFFWKNIFLPRTPRTEEDRAGRGWVREMQKSPVSFWKLASSLLNLPMALRKASVLQPSVLGGWEHGYSGFIIWGGDLIMARIKNDLAGVHLARNPLTSRFPPLHPFSWVTETRDWKGPRGHAAHSWCQSGTVVLSQRFGQSSPKWLSQWGFHHFPWGCCSTGCLDLAVRNIFLCSPFVLFCSFHPLQQLPEWWAFSHFGPSSNSYMVFPSEAVMEPGWIIPRLFSNAVSMLPLHKHTRSQWKLGMSTRR